MTANDKFFQKKRAAAVLKHGILSRYPTVFATKTGSTSQGGRVVYLDGYAGPGRYAPEAGETEGAEGSPLLAVRTAKRVEAWRRKLHCVFVERNPEHVTNLRETLAQEAAGTMVYDVLPGDVSDNLDQALAIAGESPLLTFLDPFGTGLPYADMAGRLFARSNKFPTEVLLNFNLEAVWRIGGLLTGDNTELTGARRESALARIDAFLGSDWWRETFRAARVSAQDQQGAAALAAEQVMREFCVRIFDSTGYDAFTVPIRRQPHHLPLFMMILFSRHRDAPYAFNEAVSGANKDWRHFHHELNLQEQRAHAEPDLFGGELIPETLIANNKRIENEFETQWIAVIAANIRELIAANGELDVRDRTAGIFGTTLGLANPKHLRRAWDQLTDERIVRARDKSEKLEKQRIRRA